jgi:predicted  nucleic acid-binding Zn-ribbon protein
MATDKTPIRQRITRAENSATEWKMKAIERREAAEALKQQLVTASKNIQLKTEELEETNNCCAEQAKQIGALTKQLELANRQTIKLQEEMSILKKKPSH